ncbi:PLDc N-terminal domain-containing protein [Bizionia sp. KMM 8389]
MIIISPTILVVVTLLIIALFITSLVFVFKNEQQPIFKLLWTLFIVFVPVLGSIIYILKYITEVKPKVSSY